ncbi:MAG: PhzF family phenazine biosynthesis protein [Ignavibacteriales bacterium]|nr:PhzF family phenazine biosynthesis protein [Ignavibacteriales bacterium]
MGRKILLKHVNAFTSEPFFGNPAGVVPDAKGLNEPKMQLIARELAMPETAFVLPPSQRGADLQLRWFSPSMEIPLCGHATIGAFHALAEEGMFGMKGNGWFTFRVQTKSGLLRVDVNKRAGSAVVEFHLPVPKFTILKTAPSLVMKSLGLHRSDLHRKLPVARGNYLYIPVARISRLRRIQPDMNALDRACRSLRLIGVSLVTTQTLEESSAFHSRFFAPAAGIPEDPVTGSANGPLGVYLYRYALSNNVVIPSFWLEDARLEFVGEQGDFLGRRGRVKVRLKVKKGNVEAVSIAGEAVTIFSTELLV